MGNEAPPNNPIEAGIREAQLKNENEEKIKQNKQAIEDMQAPLQSYRPGMIVDDNQAAFFTLTNYMGNVTILNNGTNDFKVGKINSIKYGKNVKVNCKSVVGQETSIMGYENAPFEIPDIQGGDKIWTVSVSTGPVQKIVPPSSTYEECVYAVENTGFIPKVTWGTTPANKQDASCDQKLCNYWPKKYPDGVPTEFQKSVQGCTNDIKVKVDIKKKFITHGHHNENDLLPPPIHINEITKKDVLIANSPTVVTQNPVVSNMPKQDVLIAASPAVVTQNPIVSNMPTQDVLIATSPLVVTQNPVVSNMPIQVDKGTNLIAPTQTATKVASNPGGPLNPIVDVQLPPSYKPTTFDNYIYIIPIIIVLCVMLLFFMKYLIYEGYI
jgi:hypothetical protein